MIQIKRIPILNQASKEGLVLQQQLNKKGGYKLVEDGIPGAKTLAALKDFQIKNITGSQGSGTIGPMTLKLLEIEVVPENPVTGESAKTRKLKGTGRDLHPTMRLLLEAAIFKGGQIPVAFLERNHKKMVVIVARAMAALEIREVGGNNKGKTVGFIQAIIGDHIPNGNGDAWCMSTVQCIIAFIEDFLQVLSMIVASEGVTDTWTRTKKNNPELVKAAALVGSFFAGQHGEKWQGHTGTVLEVLPNNKMETYEGNTGDGNMRDGDGAFIRIRDQKKNGDLINRAFLIMYADDIVQKAA